MKQKVIRLKVEREKMGLSRNKLAGRAAMASSTIGQIESGRFVPYESQLVKLAAALQFSGNPSKLLDEVEA